MYILITGSTSDIGISITKKFSNKYNLILHGRDLNKLNQLKNQLNNKKEHKIFVYDFSNLESFREDFTNYLKEENLLVDKVIHCAGLMKVMRIRSVDLNSINHIFNVNFFSIVEIISILSNKRLNKCELKSIVFISAILAKYASTGHHLYSSTKAALDGFMRSIAVDLSPNTRANSVLLGAVKTKMSEHLLANEDILNKLNKDYLLGIGMPEQISGVVNFLISDDSSWITGQEIIVDGGRTINIKNN